VHRNPHTGGQCTPPTNAARKIPIASDAQLRTPPAVSSPGSLLTPAPGVRGPSVMGPASENLHKLRRSSMHFRICTNRRHCAIPERIERASTAEYWLLGADLYAVAIRVLEIGLPVCPLLAGVFANRFTPVGTIGLGTRRGVGEWREEDPLYSAGKCSGSFFGASAHIDGQERHNQDHRPIHVPFQSRQWVTLPFRSGRSVP
jgi:hypothetical protein